MIQLNGVKKISSDFMAAFNVRQTVIGKTYNDVNPTTIAYIESLLVPYQRIILELSDEESLLSWVKQHLSEDDMMDLRADMKANRKHFPFSVNDIQEWILNSMISNLMQYFLCNEAIPSIFPWDVQRFFPEQLSSLFPVEAGKMTFPVIVVVGDRNYSYEFTLEQAIGLLLFSRAVHEKGITMQIMVCGVPLTYFDDPKNQYRWAVRDHASFFPCYRVTISDQDYQFTSAELMQGFALGGMLTEQDYHLFYSNLRRMHDVETSECIQL